MSLFSFFGFGNKKKAGTLPFEYFEPNLLAVLAKCSAEPIQKLPAIDPVDSSPVPDKFYDGYLAITPSKESAVHKVLKFKKFLKSSKYRAFAFDGGREGYLGVAIIIALSEMDILRYRQTNAYNYDLSNEDIIAKLEDLDKRYGVSISACAADWVEIRFDNLPEDMDAFAKEIYAFCPDCVDQGVGNLEALKEAVTDMQGIFLWWD